MQLTHWNVEQLTHVVQTQHGTDETTRNASRRRLTRNQIRAPQPISLRCGGTCAEGLVAIRMPLGRDSDTAKWRQSTIALQLTAAQIIVQGHRARGIVPRAAFD